MDLLDDARAMQDDLVRLRRELHREPEIGLQLPRTQERVLAALDGLPLTIMTGAPGLSSVVAVLRGGASTGRTVLLRSDMDGLPVAEQTGLEFASTNGAMHACGHDLHTAILVGAARLLSAHREALAGDVIFMFQPGEEGFDGARHMVEAGVLDAAGARPVAAYFAHVTSSTYASGEVALRPGPIMAAADTLHVTVVGAGGHGSSPFRARDPIAVAAEIVTALQTMVTRQFDVFDPVVITVGSFHGGAQHNIIPDRASFEATVRTFSSEHQAAVTERAVRLCHGIAEAHGLRAEVEWQTLYPVTMNNADEASFLADVAAELFGAQATVAMPHPHPGAEDFSRVLDAVPGAMAFLGATAPGLDPQTAAFNHSPLAMFDEAVLSSGTALYAKLALDRLHE
jgi:hippurate hydrolase